MPESTLVPTDGLSTLSGTCSLDVWATFTPSKCGERPSLWLPADNTSDTPSSSPLSEVDRSLTSLLGSSTMTVDREFRDLGVLD